MSSNVVYDLEYLKSKDFFKNQGDLKIDGKTVIWDKDNYLAYVEIENLEELEKIHNKLKKEYVKFEYFYYYIPKENKIKVFKRGCSVAFTYSDKIKREDVKKSKKDKLDKFSPENLNVLFDTKDVMDKFYNDLWKLRLDMANSIKKPIKDRDKLLVVQHFIDRLVFFYFLCQLGIVKVKYSIDDESYEYTMNKQTTKDFFDFLIENLNDSELQKLLNGIFFEGLGNEHKVNSNGYVDVHVKVGEWEFDISVPYLNGGLFREKKITTENNIEIRESEIEFTGIKELIATLNKYNWVIGDYTDDEESVWNLTPEILGHVYEKFVVGLENIGEDVKLSELKYDRNGIKYGRKKIGAYYTPEEITSYISENTIISYLFDKLGLEKYNELLNPRVAFDEFVENASEEELKRALEVLNEIRVLDPACGSGHFLVSAGNLLFDLKECICNKLVEKFGFKRELNEYKEVKKIIVDNLYGVDISETAVEIAKLRLWLWLVSQLRDKEKIEPLPNLEYNIKCGNSLIGWVDEKLGQLPLEYAYDDKIEGIFKGLITFCKDDKKKEMLLKAKELLKSTSGNILDNYVEAFHLVYEIYKVSSGSEALHLKEILEDIRERVYKSVNFAYLNYINSKLKKKDRIKEDDLLKLKPLHWRIDFGWIIKNGGFDVVIGNPPHGAKASKVEKDLWKIIYQLKERGIDSAKIFTERSIHLLKANGYLAFVIPKPSTYSYAWEDFRKFIRKYEITHCINLSKAFEDVKHEQIIIALRKSSVTEHKYIGGYFDKNEGKIVEIKYLTCDLLPNYILPCDITTKELDIARYLFKKDFSTFSEFDVFRGLPRNLASNYGEPCIKGKEIKRYYIFKPEEFVRLDKINENKLSRLKRKKVVAQNIVAHVTKPKDRIIIMAFPDEKGILTFETVTNIVPEDNYSVKTISLLLNSKFISWFVYLFIYNKAIRDMHFDEYFVKGIVLPNLDNKASRVLDILTDYMLSLNAREDSRKKYGNIINYFDEQIIDSIVYELYFKEKLYNEDKEYLLNAISKHLKPINYDRWAELYWKNQLEDNLTEEEEGELKQLEEENLRIIEEVYEDIKDDKEINNLIKKIKSHEWVKIIEK